jgi:hypothetical protein
VAEQIIIEYKAQVEGFKTDLKSLQSDLKTTETVGVQSATNTTKAFEKTEAKTKSLKTQLKELKAELANATDPKDIERLAKAAGKLTDQIEDASDAAKVFASESKFEQIGNALGSIGGKLRNLDFKGAADQSKLLVSATKSLTFKEALGGVKDLGATLFNIGKSLLLNPIFLIGGAVGLIISNFDKLKNSGGLIGSLFTSIGNIISAVIDTVTKLTDAIGLTSTVLVDSTAKMIAEYDKQLKATKDYYDQRIALDEAAGKDSSANRSKQLSETIRIANEEIQKLLVIRKGYYKTVGENAAGQRVVEQTAGRILTDDEQKKWNELIEIVRVASNDLQVLQTKSATKKNDDNKKNNDKELADYKKHLEELAALEKTLRDLRAGNIVEDDQRRITQLTNTFNDEKAKYAGHGEIIKELQIKLNRDIEQVYKDRQSSNAKILKEIADDAIKIFKAGAKELVAEDTQLSQKFIDNQKKITEEEKKQIEIRKQLQSESIHLLSSTIEAAATINSNIANQQIQDIEDKSERESAILQSQYDQGIISKLEYEKRKAELDKKTRIEEAKVKKREFETNKQLALIQVAINAAQAISKTAGELGYPAAIPFIALAAANAALQIAVIESQPTPKFAKGVVGLKGKGTGTSDEIHAMLSKGESVIIADESSKHEGLLKAMNKRQTTKYINEFYIAPALKAQKKKYESAKEASFADNILKSMMINNGFNDDNLLESMKQSRRNDREIAMFMVKELKDSQRSKHKW